MRYLRYIRIGSSAALTLLLFIVLSDFYRIIPEWLIKTATYFQLIPSILSFTAVLSLAGTGFICILIITFISGRAYCSFICPLGFSQDIFIRAGRKLFKRKNGCYSAPHNKLFYGILALSITSFLVSGTTLLLWIDPFSIFGRFVSYSASAPLISFNNFISATLIRQDIFLFHSVNIKPSTAGVIFSISGFSIIMILSIFRGRLYCNTICPAGALLSIISRISLYRIKLDESGCIHCGKCESMCKSSCIDHSNLHVDTSRCVLCFNCISICPVNSITFSGRRESSSVPEKTETSRNGITRFSFISGLLLAPRVLHSGSGEKPGLFYQEPHKQKHYIRKIFSSPPGSLSIDLFNRRCTGCSLCVSACPTAVLQPAVLQYGLTGIMQPFMDYSSGFCNYDCTKCGDICPAGAISRNKIEDKRQIQIGRSVFIIENCVTYTNGTNCGACSEHCPTKAVYMVPFRNNLVIPEINNDICTGCGACEYACPVRPLKAIYVKGNESHLTAKLPENIESEKPEKSEVFPF